MQEFQKVKDKAEKKLRSFWERLSIPQRIVFSYVVVIVFGALLFINPLSWKPATDGSLGGQPPAIEDCIFLSTSAVCVTGLATIDYAAQLSVIGKTVLLLLIEIGGLGTMTLATFFLAMFTRRASTSLTLSTHETFTQGVGGHIRWLGVKVFTFAIFIQAVGSLLLFYHWKNISLPNADLAFSATFHACSAFCNAGFALFSNSLETFGEDPITNLIIISLTIIGGLGYLVHFELGTHSIKTFGKKKIYLSLNSRIILLGTILLLAGGAFLFFALESSNSMSGLPLWQRGAAAVFQSAMTRTCGFSTVDWSTAREVTCFIAMFLMFIGAGPGSTAGGIKLTTAAILGGIITSRLHGRADVVLLNRQVSQDTILRAVYVALMSMLTVGFLIGSILLAESLMAPETRPELLKVAFESVSAFGTVGLSLGITGQLTWLSKLILCFGMLAGRVGPLSLSLTFYRAKESVNFSYPEEQLMIG